MAGTRRLAAGATPGRAACSVGFDPATYSAGLLDLVAGSAVGRDGLTAEEVQAGATDLRSLGTDAFFSLNRYLFCATKAACAAVGWIVARNASTA